MSGTETATPPRAALSDAKRALLKKWMATASSPPPTAADRIPRRDAGGPAPLSFPQIRLWFLDQLVPGSAAYNISGAVRLEGILSGGILERALDECVRRQDALRTRFVPEDGVPFQVVDPHVPRPLPRVDLAGLPAHARTAEAERLTTEDATRPFDLAAGPVLRTTLVRLDDRSHVVLLTVHHIVSDGWSQVLFFQDLTALYRAFLAGGPSPLPELPIQYADFAAWQQAWLRGAELERQLGFWRRQLTGAEPLELPTDRPRPAVQSFRGSTVHFELDPQLSVALQHLAQSENASPFMVLLGAFEVLIARYSRQRDVSVGFPVANRKRIETEKLVGLFANTLVLRTPVEPGESFRQLLGRLRAVALAAYEHQDLPFEKLVDELAPERDMSRNPLFQVMFTFQKGKRSQIDLPQLSFQQITADRSTAMFDLWLSMQLMASHLRGHLEYNSDLFDRSTVRRLLHHLETVFRAVARDPDAPVGQILFATPPERHQLLHEWNDTRRRYPDVPRLHDLISAQAHRTPDAVAVCVEGAAVSHRELHGRSIRLARRLRAAGQGPGSVVGVLMERSLEMVVALVAVLEAGAAYLPLDPTLPRERLAFLAADSGTEVVLTVAALEARVPAGARTMRPEAPEEANAVEHLPAGGGAEAGDVAYVIYTSGSTGRPKGVMVPHGGIVNRLLWMQERYRLDADDRVLQKTPFTFDVSVWEFFWPLLTGAALVMARPEGHKDPAYLVDRIEVERVTTVHFVPSMLAAFLEAPGLDRISSLRRVVCSGEALPAELAHRAGNRLPGELHNLYGPTEASVDVTAWECTPDDGRRGVPIGRPIANLAIHLFDPSGQPAPIGVPAELHVAGTGLARGYLRRPDLTATAFVPNPLSEAPGDRVYRTGDLVRRLPDGALQFLGRIDHQVKLRGLRIELGEVEALLDEHPDVLASAVAVREEAPGDRRLCAYVVPRPDPTAEAGAPLSGEKVSEWRQVFDRTYEEPGLDTQHPAFNVAGWNSSYTGEPIPEEEMRVWVETTVERILGLRPRRVLEIGCGTGLLLFRVAPRCERYVGRDVSPRAVTYLEHHLARAPIPGVELACRAADDFDGVKVGAFDIVVLNSVAQYFPRVDYLLRVIEGALAALAPGGSLFLGDLRSLPLLEAFHGSVELHQAADATPVAQVVARQRWRAAQEGELVIDPELLLTLPRHLPRIRGIELQLKRGRHRNELALFRYDAILHTGGSPAGSGPELSWDDVGRGLEDLHDLLREESPSCVRLVGVPDARMAVEARRTELLAGSDPPATAGELRSLLAAGGVPAGAVEPDDLWELGEDLGYDVEVRWGRRSGELEAEFRRRDAELPVEPPPSRLSEETPAWHRWANDPLGARLAARLVPELRQLVKEHLPEYMVPQAFAVLPALPLTSSGKVDRAALPPPPPVLPELEAGFVAPRDPVEAALAGIWAEVLGLPEVGIHNNFFELGGNSVHSIQVVARARRAGLHLEPRHLFQHQTVADLAAVAEPSEASPAEPPLAHQTPAQRWLAEEPPEALPAYRRAWLDLDGTGGPLGTAALEALSGAVGRAAAATPTLRRVARHDRDGWQWSKLVEPWGVLERIDLDGSGPDLIEESQATWLAALDPASGPSLAAAVLAGPDGAANPRAVRLVLAAHPLSLDEEGLALLAERVAEEAGGLVGDHRRPAVPVPDPRLRHPWTGLESPELERLLALRPDVEDLYPASALQSHMYRRLRSAPVSGLFVVQRGMPITALLTEKVLRDALQTVVDRYAFLRTSLAESSDGRVFQLVHRSVEVEMETVDWRALPAAEQEHRFAERTAAERARGFDPAQPHPLRMVVARTADDRLDTLTTTNYMRLDGWSLNVVISEILALCRSGMTGTPVELPPVRPYTDYLAWMRRRDAEAAAEFWRTTLEGCPGPSRICDQGADEEEVFTRRHVYLDDEVTAGLQELCRRHRVTLNTAIQGAYALTVAGATGRDDVVFGNMVAGRPAELEGIETMVGPFVNVLPLRVRVPREQSLGPWLESIQGQQVALRPFEHTPIEHVRRWLEWPEAEPLFEAYLAFQNLPEFTGLPTKEKAAGTSAHPAEAYLAQMEHPLRVDAFPGSRVALVFSYYPRRISSARVTALMAGFEEVLRAMAADPTTTLAHLAPTLERS